MSLLLVSWQLARLPTIVFSRVFRVGAGARARGDARARLRSPVRARVTSVASPRIRSRDRRVPTYVRADVYTAQRHAQSSQHARRPQAERVCERRRASYVTGTTSGRDVYVHALHAFLDRFLHREAPRGSGEHPKTEHVAPVPADPKSHRSVFFLPLPARARRVQYNTYTADALLRCFPRCE